jgi:hypothetical protein
VRFHLKIKKKKTKKRKKKSILNSTSKLDMVDTATCPITHRTSVFSMGLAKNRSLFFDRFKVYRLSPHQPG